ncbi:MAG: hypothetical protein IPP94_08895 [Ignavibacteria bacterium]|nr:hypothetical protein [Ignavibacteria bacterium]
MSRVVFPRAMMKYSLLFGIILLVGTPAALRSQWVQTDLPKYANVTSIAHEDSFVMAGTIADGIWYSTNGGRTWAESNTNGQIKAVSAMLIQDSAIYAGTGFGLFASTDRGMSWYPASSGFPIRPTIRSLAVMDTALFVGTMAKGLFVSFDSAKTWSERNNGLEMPHFINALHFLSNTLYAGTGTGVFASTNLGVTWTKKSSGLVPESIHKLDSRDTVLYAGGMFGDVFVSMNRGNSWEKVYSSPVSTDVTSFVSTDTSECVGFYAGGIMQSTEHGTSWREFNDGFTMPTVQIRSLCRVGNSMLAGTAGHGLWMRENARTTHVESRAEMMNPGLMVNYPNPFVAETSIIYTVTTRAHVRIRLVDSRGVEIAVLVDEEKPEGTYCVPMSAQHLPAGVYLCELRMNGSTTLRKIELVK